MSLNVTPAAAACFKEEWGYRSGDYVRVYVRYSSGSEDAFSLGITRDTPRSAAAVAEQQGIRFYVEQDDVWFLEGRDLTLDCGAGREIVIRLGESSSLG